MFKQHPRRLYTWTSLGGNTRNQIDYISKMENKLDELSHVSGRRLRHRSSVATLKVRLAKRQRQNSIPPLNLEELKENKAVQFAAEVTNRFTALEAVQHEVTLEDLWKGTKSARETIGSGKRKRNGYLMRLTQQSGKREKQKAKIRTDIKN